MSQCSTPQIGKDSLAIANKEKQKGVHAFGIVDSTNFEELKEINIEWITLVSWAYQETHLSAELRHFNGDSLRMAKRDSSFIARINQVHKEGFKVFFKPHIWMETKENGKWRSDILPTTDENWNIWKEDYRDFILRYARIAEEAKAEMFCVGTELTLITKEYPEYWVDLIKEIRTIYKGKLTYAANWYQEYEHVDFWEELDYIGIQAYFPLTKNKNPGLQEIIEGWDKHLSDIIAVSSQYNKPILFTEMGYKSTVDSAIRPWEWMEYSERSDELCSPQTQAHCYQAFFNTLWNQPWFAGVHIWQMRTDYHEWSKPGRKDLNFTPQGKPAMDIIKEGFKK